MKYQIGADNVYITYNNKRHTMAEWSRILNIPYGRIQSRIYRGLTFEQAIQPINYKNGNKI